MKKWGLLLISIIALLSCERTKEYSAFVQKEGICLEINGIASFEHSDQDCQIAFNPNKKEFRAQTDDMSDWYIVQMSHIPQQVDEEIKASIKWTKYSSIGHKNNITLRVVRCEGDKMWLWEPSGQTAVVIRVLE